jgi:hypothetical protein
VLEIRHRTCAACADRQKKRQGFVSQQAAEPIRALAPSRPTSRHLSHTGAQSAHRTETSHVIVNCQNYRFSSSFVSGVHGTRARRASFGLAAEAFAIPNCPKSSSLHCASRTNFSTCPPKAIVFLLANRFSNALAGAPKRFLETLPS